VEKIRASEFPFGVLELDGAGTVVSFSPDDDAGAGERAARGVVGHNFFEEIAPVEELQSFKGRFLAFMAFGDSIERYSFSFPLDGFVVAGQILLARLADRADLGGQRLALVRLTPSS
jgi:photoactive yellow protein